MKLRCSKRRQRALTLLEVLVVLFILFILVAMFLPTRPHAAKRRSRQIVCLNNLKQIGLAYRIWKGDNEDNFPMDASVTNGGTMELLAAGKDVWRTFQVISNELSTPKILFCPADIDHTEATYFSTNFSAKNISYFVGLDATTNSPQAFLSGDDNFEISGVSVKSGLLELSTNAPIAWTAARHHLAGNIGLADGSVQQLATFSLQQMFQNTGLATNRLAIP